MMDELIRRIITVIAEAALYKSINKEEKIDFEINGNICSGKYPLCRSYYLAYSGELSDAETDLLAY